MRIHFFKYSYMYFYIFHCSYLLHKFRSETWGPVGILHLTLIFCIIQSVLYSVMYLLSKRKDRRVYDFELENRTLAAENNTVVHYGRQIKSTNSYQ